MQVTVELGSETEHFSIPVASTGGVRAQLALPADDYDMPTTLSMLKILFPPSRPVLGFYPAIKTPQASDRSAGGPPPILPRSRNLHGIAVGDRERDAAFVADESLLELGDEVDAAAGVVEELETPLDILELDRLGLALLAQQGRRGDQVAGVAQAGLLADLGEQGQRVRGDVDFLLLGPDAEDLSDFVALVRVRADDDDAVEEVEGEAVRGEVVGAADPRVASIAGHDHDRGQLVLQGTVHVGETFNVEHMNLIDEEDPGHNFRFPLLFPLPHFGVDLVADFAADLPGVSGEEGQKSLRSRVDDVDFVETDRVNDFFPFLQFTVRTLNELGVCAHGVVVARSSK